VGWVRVQIDDFGRFDYPADVLAGAFVGVTAAELVDRM
jgi:hypothetical protein